ncbi:hypothetical protein G6F60_004634 [Rhizopus arrhizus]|nr:hypothetical protein G6F60_004634 [Rhizopus arrhizus]
MVNLAGGTFFAPDNTAFEHYEGASITRDVLLYHLLPVEYKTSGFRQGQIVESMYYRPGYLETNSTGQRLKFRKKSFIFYYVNEARIIDKDIFVNKNTTLHVINQVLEPPKLLSDLLKLNDRKMYDLIDKVKVPLWVEERPFTTFISSNYLLDKFNQVEQHYLISKSGFKDLEKLLKYEIIPQPIYLGDCINGEKEYKTESGEVIKIKINNGQITVNDLKVLKTDILAANGVIHLLEDVPYSDSVVFDTRKYLIGLNATKFISLMDAYGLGSFLNNENKTILALTNDVIDEDEIPNNRKLPWLSYHILDGAWKSKGLYNNMLIKTQYYSTQLNNKPQRLVVYVDELDSISFGPHSKVIGNELSIDGNQIFRISSPLDLPLDIFSNLVIDLELSTFIAALYVSGVVHDIESSKGITLFVPVNQAFKSLGIVSRYLFHPSGHVDLQSVLRYHVTLTSLYYQDLVGNIQQAKTLANEDLLINGSNHQQVRIGSHHDLNNQGVIGAADILVSNGVVHKIDRLQIPHHLNITHRQLLRGIDANLMESILKRTGLMDKIEGTNWLILAPIDKAFEQIDLESMWNDTSQLERIAKLHILPRSHKTRLLGDQEFDTLLSSEDRIILKEMGSANKMVWVRGQPLSVHAHVLDMGYTNTGDSVGGVIEIDSVLSPVERGIFGLPWIWSMMLVCFFYISIICIVLFIGYISIKKWTRKRNGYETILDAEQEENRDIQ